MNIPGMKFATQIGTLQTAKTHEQKQFSGIKVSSGDEKKQEKTEAAVIIELSEKAKAYSNGETASNAASELKAIDMSKMVKTDMRIDLEQLKSSKNYRFGEGTLEGFISETLHEEGLENHGSIANELGQRIKSAYYGNGDSIEQRTINREAGLAAAAHIAENYFSDPDKAKAFMDKINEFAEYDIMREKGYIYEEGTDAAPYRNYEKPGAATSNNLLDSLSQEYISNRLGVSARESNSTEDITKYWNSYFSALENSSGKELYGEILAEKIQEWLPKLEEEFDANEKNVTSIIEQSNNTLDATDLSKNLQQLLESLGLSSVSGGNFIDTFSEEGSRL